VKHGVVQDKLWLPGLLKLKMLDRSRFFGRICSVRGEFGYWVFEGDWQPGAAAILELQEGGRRRHHRRHAVPLALRARQPLRRGEERDVPRRDAHSAALGRERQAVRRRRPTTRRTRRSSSTAASIAQINSSWCTRVRRDDLVTFHVDGTLGSAVAG
jgi:hypothetical protein